MADTLPPELKVPEISRLISRANQIRSHKPAIAYWCEYRAVNLIVSKGLHSASPACGEYTASLLGRLEETKTERADDDAIVDNAAGQAYVEQFAQDIFARGERDMTSNKVTRQTADTLSAAATFLDLSHEWGQPSDEILKKIKFAKFHAARILRAFREGNDPNESNPVVEEQTVDDPDVVVLDPNDPEVQQFTSGPPPPVTIEDVPDAPEPPSEPSPIAPADLHTSTEAEPYAPSPMTMSPAPPQPPHPVPHTQPVVDLPPTAPPPADVTPTWDAPPAVPASAPAPVSFSPPPRAPAPAPAPVPVAAPIPAPSPVPSAVSNQKDLNKAQRHAKFAISALNFDDVPTAVQELRNALAVLGAL